MQTDKIEITWNLVPSNENQFYDENEFYYRIKSKDFDVCNKFFVENDVINNEVAFGYILCDLFNRKVSEDSEV